MKFNVKTHLVQDLDRRLYTRLFITGSKINSAHKASLPLNNSNFRVPKCIFIPCFGFEAGEYVWVFVCFLPSFEFLNF